MPRPNTGYLEKRKTPDGKTAHYLRIRMPDGSRPRILMGIDLTEEQAEFAAKNWNEKRDPFATAPIEKPKLKEELVRVREENRNLREEVWMLIDMLHQQMPCGACKEETKQALLASVSPMPRSDASATLRERPPGSGRWYCRVSLGNGARPSFVLTTCKTREQADARRIVLADMTAKLRGHDHVDVAPELLKRAASRDGQALRDVIEAVDLLCERGRKVA